MYHNWRRACDPEGARWLRQLGPVDVEQDAHCGGAPFRPRHGAHADMAGFGVRADGGEQRRDADGHLAAGQHAHAGRLHFVVAGSGTAQGTCFWWTKGESDSVSCEPAGHLVATTIDDDDINSFAYPIKYPTILFHRPPHSLAHPLTIPILIPIMHRPPPYSSNRPRSVKTDF